MLDKIRNIKNPLTVIAIFAALTEVGGTVVLPFLSDENQSTFMWFLISFPSALLILFFATLNFNPTVLYAPSDFQNEENFLNVLRNRKNLEVSFSRLNEDLEGSTDKILETIISRFGQEAERQRQSLRQLIDSHIAELKSSVERTEESVNVVSLQALPRSELQARIVAYLFSEKEPLTLGAISKAMSMNEDAVGRAVTKLAARDVLTISKTDDGTKYELSILYQGAARDRHSAMHHGGR